MFEKVNPAHPDKVADRIAGAIVLASLRFFQSLRFVKAAKPSGKRQSRADLCFTKSKLDEKLLFHK